MLGEIFLDTIADTLVKTSAWSQPSSGFWLRKLTPARSTIVFRGFALVTETLWTCNALRPKQMLRTKSGDLESVHAAKISVPVYFSE